MMLLSFTWILRHLVDAIEQRWLRMFQADYHVGNNQAISWLKQHRGLSLTFVSSAGVQSRCTEYRSGLFR